MEERREVVYDQEGRRIEVIVNGLECCHTIASLEGEQGRSGQPERSCSMRPATTDDESRAHAPTERRARGILGDAVVDARAAEGSVTPPSVSRDLVLGGYTSSHSSPGLSDDDEPYRQCWCQGTRATQGRCVRTCMQDCDYCVFCVESAQMSVCDCGLECCHTIASLEGEQGCGGQPERSRSRRPATTDDESRAHALTERRARGILGDAVVDARAAEGSVTPPSVSRDLVLGGYMSSHSSPGLSDDDESYRQC